MDFAIGLACGLVAGYVIRDIISRRRHLRARQRRRMGVSDDHR
jgi:hypothetical protein